MIINPEERYPKKSVFFFSCIIILFIGILSPVQASALGLGSAGSLTKEGLFIGLAILGVIFLVFMGLLLMSKSNELIDIEKKSQKIKVDVTPPGEIMNFNEKEINDLIRKRQLKINPQS